MEEQFIASLVVDSWSASVTKNNKQHQKSHWFNIIRGMRIKYLSVSKPPDLAQQDWLTKLRMGGFS